MSQRRELRCMLTAPGISKCFAANITAASCFWTVRIRYFTVGCLPHMFRELRANNLQRTHLLVIYQICVTSMWPVLKIWLDFKTVDCFQSKVIWNEGKTGRWCMPRTGSQIVGELGVRRRLFWMRSFASFRSYIHPLSHSGIFQYKSACGSPRVRWPRVWFTSLRKMMWRVSLQGHGEQRQKTTNALVKNSRLRCVRP